ncbi:homoserine O-acetyltransferase [Paenimyroides aquimaris]|uniref:Homoserine O-acetyltransferase n=1 Tax=Paenimyroides marinum TaxID=1159016 RepID=A0A1H6M4V7_9FLAO|nr:alpha/beta fold hydrolase [Paenimyroides aquimaris]SEH96334.1 homoserine O-acetyltransferase [Paenimyroides aquimaris]
MNKKRIPKQLTSHFADKDCEISYQWICIDNEPKPTLVILHALTGNSTVSGKDGWWNEIVGENKTINCNKYNILSIDTLGNGYATNTHLHIHSIENITVNDVAKINLWLLDELQLTTVHSLIGGSLGGAIAWEMWKEKPVFFQQLISIGAHPLENHWIKGITFLQKNLLQKNESGYEQARMWSMLFYRNALGVDSKFNQSSQSIENWLTYHGASLKARFSEKSYEIMNHLLGAIGKGSYREQFLNAAQKSTTQIVVISISSDWLFHPQHQIEWIEAIKQVHKNITHHSLESVHGHDAFLIEFEKLGRIIENYL